MSWRRRLAAVGVVLVGVLLWIVIPAYVAAGMALDNPAWDNPDDPALDPARGGPFVDRTSWWPPGRHYEWTGAITGTHRRAVDPWGNPVGGHVWTAAVALATGAAVVRVVRGRRPEQSATTPSWL